MKTLKTILILSMLFNLNVFYQFNKVVEAERNYQIQSGIAIHNMLMSNINRGQLARITCYGATGNVMANGEYPYYGAVASSDRTIKLGTEVIIDGQTFTVKDRTAKWVNEEFEYPTFDVYRDDCSMEYGAKIIKVLIK